MKKFLLLFLTALLCFSLVCCREEEPEPLSEPCFGGYRVEQKEVFLSDLVWAKNNPTIVEVLEQNSTLEEKMAVSNMMGDRSGGIHLAKLHEIDSVLIPSIENLPYRLEQIIVSTLHFAYYFVPLDSELKDQYPNFCVSISREKNSVVEVATDTGGKNEVPLVEKEGSWAYYHGGRAVSYPKNAVFTDFEQTASTILFDHYLITSNGAVLLESGINLTQEEQPFAP